MKGVYGSDGQVAAAAFGRYLVGDATVGDARLAGRGRGGGANGGTVIV